MFIRSSLDTENQTAHPCPLSLSTPLKTQPPTASLASSLKERNAKIWECVARIPDASGGFLFKYQLRPEFDTQAPGISEEEERYKSQLTESAQEHIYPAIELLEEDLGFLSPSYKKKAFKEHPPRVDFTTFQEAIRRGAIFRELGYLFERKEKGAFLTLPDRQALLERWKTYRETKNPDLPSISIQAGDHIETDLAFIESFLSSDALLSSGKEFVHDHTVHLMALIHLLLEDPKSYKTTRARLRAIVAKVKTYLELAWQKLEDSERWPMVSLPPNLQSPQTLEILGTILGALTDAMAAQYSYAHMENILSSKEPWGVSTEGLTGNWGSQCFWQKRYPNRHLNDWTIHLLAGALRDFGIQVGALGLQEKHEEAIGHRETQGLPD